MNEEEYDLWERRERTRLKSETYGRERDMGKMKEVDMAKNELRELLMTVSQEAVVSMFLNSLELDEIIPVSEMLHEYYHESLAESDRRD